MKSIAALMKDIGKSILTKFALRRSKGTTTTKPQNYKKSQLGLSDISCTLYLLKGK